ncbi:hypothetical protein [Roseivirga seohaensis]
MNNTVAVLTGVVAGVVGSKMLGKKKRATTKKKTATKRKTTAKRKTARRK